MATRKTTRKSTKKAVVRRSKGPREPRGTDARAARGPDDDGKDDGAKDDTAEPARRSGPGALWSGTLSFGLVAMPVEVHSASRPGGVPLRMLAPDGTPLVRRWVCSEEGRDLSPDDLVRAFELEDGEHVVLTDEELESAAPRKSRDIDLRRFVDVSELDPMTFERAFVLTPGGDSTKPYRLLVDALESGGKAGIATFVMRTKEYLAAILAHDGILWAQTLRFADELRGPDDVGLPQPERVPVEAAERFALAIEQLSKEKLEPKALADSRAERLRELAEAKRERGEDVVEAPEESADEESVDPESGEPRGDVFELIRSRLAASGGARRSQAKRTASEAGTRRKGARRGRR